MVRNTATLTITATAGAPGLVNLTLLVTSYLGGGSEPGENVSLSLMVAHFANGTLTASKATSGHGSHGAGNGTAMAIGLALDYTTNAESLLSFEAKTSAGEVREIDATRVSPPSFQNKTRSQVAVVASFEPPAQWAEARLTFTAYLTPVVGGARVPVGNATLALENDDAEVGHDADGHVHDEDGKDTPAPAVALVGLALLAFAARRR